MREPIALSQTLRTLIHLDRTDLVIPVTRSVAGQSPSSEVRNAAIQSGIIALKVRVLVEGYGNSSVNFDRTDLVIEAYRHHIET